MSRTHKPRESKPSFIIPPRRQFIDEGGRAKFKTSFDGEPEPTVTWMKDKAVLKNGGKYKMYNKDSFYFLELLSVDPDDNGNYRCVITNRLGTAEVSAELEVFCKPKPRTLSSFSSRVEPSFDKELTDATTTEGSTLKLECLLKGHPKPFVQWYFNGKILRRSHGAREAFDDARATLTIKNVCQKHAGRYECQASNILGEVKTTCAITVRAPSSTSPSVEMKGASLDQKEAKEQPSEMLMNNESGSTEDGDSLHEGKRTVLESTRKKETVEAAGVKEGTSQKESSVQKGVRGEEEQRAGNAEQGPLNREVRAAKKDKAPPTGEIEPKEKRRREASVEKKSWNMVVGEIIGGKEEHQMEKTKGKDSAAIIREELSEKDEKLTRGSQRPAIEENQLTEPQDTVIGENVQLAKKDQPPEERQRVTPGKEQLTEERVQLTEEKEQLTEEKEPVTEEKEQLTEEKEPLTEEKEQLTEEKEQLTKEKEQLTKENEQLTKENEQLTKEKEQLTKEKEQLSVGKECLTKESEHQIEEKDQSSKEKDQMTEVKYPSAEETKTFRDVKDQPTEESVQSSSEETKLLTKEKLTEEEKQIEEKLKLSEETELSRVDNETLTMKKEQLITSGEPSVPETEILASNEKPFAAKNESVTDKKEYNEPSPVKLPYDATDNELVMAASESSRHEEEEPFSSKSTTYAATDSARNLPETVITHGVLEDTVISVNKPLQNKTVKVGDAAILECQIWGLSAVAMATGSQSEPSVSWTKDDHELVPSDSLKMEVSGDRAWIEMKNTRKGDGGEYMCVVRRGTVKVWTSCVLTVDAGGENAAAKPADKDDDLVTMTTGQPPSFSKGLHDLEVSDGDWVELEVEVKGDKPIQVCWLHGSRDVKDDDKVYQLVTEGDVHKLIIRDAFPEDTGRYICEVYNKFGDDETSCVLTIKEPHGEGTSPFAKLSRRKHDQQSVVEHALGQHSGVPHTLGQRVEGQHAELLAIEETTEKLSANKLEPNADKKQVQASQEVTKVSAIKHGNLAESPFVRAKKTLGSDVSKAVRTDNTPRANTGVKTGSRFARSKQMFESPKATKLEKKVELPVRKLRHKFEFTEVKSKPVQTQAEHLWKKTPKTVNTTEDKSSKQEIKRKYESCINGNDSFVSDKESLVEVDGTSGNISESSVNLVEPVVVCRSSTLTVSESSCVVKETPALIPVTSTCHITPSTESSRVVKETAAQIPVTSTRHVTPSTERVVPTITKPEPSTIKVTSQQLSPTISNQLPMIEIILPADIINPKLGNRQVSENNNNAVGPPELRKELETGAKPEDQQNRFVSSVTFGTIGHVVSGAPSLPGTSTIEIVPSVSTSGREVVEPVGGDRIIVGSQSAGHDIKSPASTGGYRTDFESTSGEPPKHEVTSLVIRSNSSLPAYKAIDFTIDLAANQVINVTPERNYQASASGSEFSLVNAQGIAVVGQPIRAADRSIDQEPEVKPTASNEVSVKKLDICQVAVAQETSFSNQPFTAVDTLTSQDDTDSKTVVSCVHGDTNVTNQEIHFDASADNSSDMKSSNFSDVRSRFERSRMQDRPKGELQDKHVTTQWKSPVAQDNLVGDSNKPTFVRRPKSLNVNEGSSAIFIVQVNGQPMPTVQWQRNGTMLTENERFKFSQSDDTHTFEIGHVQSSDAGRYTCVVSNPEGAEKCSVSLVVKQIENTDVTDFRGLLKARSQVKTFHVIGTKATAGKPAGGEQRDFRSVLRRHSGTHEQPKFLTTLPDTVVGEGERVTLQVKVIGSPQPRITWCHDNMEIKESRYCKMTHNPVSHVAELVISEACPEDGGVYLCKAESEAGYAETSCSLKIKGNSADLQQPSLDGQSSPLHDERCPEDVASGMTTEIKLTRSESSESRSGTKPQIHGNEDAMSPDHVVVEEKLQMSGEVNQCSSELSISCDGIPGEEATPMAKGTVANLSQSAGESEESCFTGEEPPMIVNLLPQSLNILIGSDIELSGCFVGIPKPTVKWFVEECRTRTELVPDDRVKILTTGKSSVLQIMNAGEDDTGIYTLEISNHLGFNQLSSSVTVEDKPDPPVSQPFISNISNNSLILSWYGASYDGGSPILSYMVEMRRENQSEWMVLSDDVKHTSYAVSSLVPNEGYEFRVRAGNRHGFGEPSKSSDIVFTMEKQPTEVEETRPVDVVKLDELPFEPRVVDVKKDKKFEESYYLGEQIGRGKFGCVYKCTDKLTGRQYAAKFIKAARVSQKTDVKQEISVMNELHHPKLLLLWDAYESRKEIILVMEHIGGGELLSRVVDEDYVLTERECVHFMRQICDGVKFIHEQNIVHLDLKPENVMCITKNSNEIKIIDFGLARKLDLNKDNKVMFGTAEFVAPEVVNYDAIGIRTDMWSVGVICYILLSGLSPFAGESDAETFSNVTMAQYDFDEEEFEEISDDAKDFIDKLLQRERKKRMSARDCLKHIWLAQDVKYMKAKRISTEKHKRFLNRIKWRKAKVAVEMINRMQKVMSLGGCGRSLSRSSTTSSQSRSINGSSSHSRTGSDFSDGCCSLSGEKPANDVTEIGDDVNVNNNNKNSNNSSNTSELCGVFNGE